MNPTTNQNPTYERFDDNFSGGQGEVLTLKSIVMQHLNRIARLTSDDWHGG